MIAPLRLLAVFVTVGTLAACGTAAATTSGSRSPSALTRTAFGGGGVDGQLVRIAGTTLTLSTTSGDSKVAYTSATTITARSTGTISDIAVGECLTSTTTKGSNGVKTAVSAELSQPVDGNCTTGAAAQPGLGGSGFGGAPPSGAARPSGQALPSGAARPSGAAAGGPAATGLATASGRVTAMDGDVVTLKETSGTSVTVTVPTNLSVTEDSAVTASALTLESCVAATGTSKAGLLTATALVIEPGTTAGCFVGGTAGGTGAGSSGGGAAGGGPGGAGAPAGGGAPPGAP